MGTTSATTCASNRALAPKPTCVNCWTWRTQKGCEFCWILSLTTVPTSMPVSRQPWQAIQAPSPGSNGKSIHYMRAFTTSRRCLVSTWSQAARRGHTCWRSLAIGCASGQTVTAWTMPMDQPGISGWIFSKPARKKTRIAGHLERWSLHLMSRSPLPVGCTARSTS